MPKQDKQYVSDADKFLEAFDREHPEKSASQQAEIKKFKRLNKLRDHQDENETNDQIWQDF